MNAIALFGSNLQNSPVLSALNIFGHSCSVLVSKPLMSVYALTLCQCLSLATVCFVRNCVAFIESMQPNLTGAPVESSELMGDLFCIYLMIGPVTTMLDVS